VPLVHARSRFAHNRVGLGPLQIVLTGAVAGGARHRRAAILARVLGEHSIADVERGEAADGRSEVARPTRGLVADERDILKRTAVAGQEDCAAEALLGNVVSERVVAKIESGAVGEQRATAAGNCFRTGLTLL